MKKIPGFFTKKTSKEDNVPKAGMLANNDENLFVKGMPAEIYLQIFQYLKVNDVEKLRKVCKEFANASSPAGQAIFQLMIQYEKTIKGSYAFVSDKALPLYQPFLTEHTKEDKKLLFNTLLKDPESACDIQYIKGEIHNFFTWAVKCQKQALLNEIYQHQILLFNEEHLHNGFTKLHWAILCNQSLAEIKACTKPSISLFRDNPINAGEKVAPFSIVMCAIMMNRADVLEFLFTKNPRIDLNYCIANCEFSAMMLAVIFDRTDMIDFLLAHKGDVNIQSWEKAGRINHQFLKPYLIDIEDEKTYSALELAQLMHRNEILEKFSAVIEQQQINLKVPGQGFGG